MNAISSSKNRLVNPQRLFQVFKYIVDVLLAYNILLWFQEDLAASADVEENGSG